MKKSTCPRCGKPTKRIRTTAGAHITLDNRPRPHGSYRLTSRWNFALADREPLAVPLTRDDIHTAQENNVPLYAPHLSVCTGPARPRRVVLQEDH